ncbi:hypothetical protein GC173_06965 [bacterium]|nr:hypothetical protein [bacterium]
MTNHEFFRQLLRFCDSVPEDLSLVDFLLRLRSVLHAERSRSAFTPGDLLAILERSLVAAPAPMPAPADYPQTEATFDDVIAIIDAQLCDLVEMDRAGTLNKKGREFGLTSPRGNHWYNFTPGAYLECGASGVWDGIMDVHLLDGGNAFTIDMEGETTPLSADDANTTPEAMEPFGWETVAALLENGRLRE